MTEENILVSKAKKIYKDYSEQIPKTSEEVGWFWGKFGVFILLIFAILIDVLGLIFSVIDLASIGIIGWILRIFASLIYVVYFVWFWIESKKFDYSEGKKFAEETIQKIKNYSKKIITSLRAIIGVSIPAKWIPIIGAIIDVLPIETLSVVFLFYVWPKLINRFINE